MTMSSRSLINRLAPYFSARVRQNSRLLNSSSAVREPKTSSPESADAIIMTECCVRRMKELQGEENSEKLLRLSIEAGGCSGFQYNFSLDDKTNNDDRVFEQDGVKLVIDNISFDFVKGSTIDYVEELIRSAFQGTLFNLLELEEYCSVIRMSTSNIKLEGVDLLYIPDTFDDLRFLNSESLTIDEVSVNPSAVGGCSCKSSFMAK